MNYPEFNVRGNRQRSSKCAFCEEIVYALPEAKKTAGVGRYSQNFDGRPLGRYSQNFDGRPHWNEKGACMPNTISPFRAWCKKALKQDSVSAPEPVEPRF